ncbi:MAG TPA: serine/threonine-protein kinase [Gemmataceae bacterium]|jgi:serine/threonine protein kinase|nr:serine/threonine-protein kinase [Gemmataceae bacterium]
MLTAPALDVEFPSELDDGDGVQTAVLGRDPTPSDVPEAIELPPLGAFLGRCQLRSQIATGPHSAVYLGDLWDLRLPVAVKVLTPRRSADRPVLAAHLRAEFRALSRLNHANIARLWDFREDGDYPHLATEYVDCLTVEQLRLQHGGWLSPRLAVRIALKAVDGLMAAWRLGLVHRDVKPDNLLFTPAGEVKVIDWGLSAWAGEELPATPTSEVLRFVGTPAYLPPEMARPGKPFDHRTDVYGLGATLYHAVTGRLPFDYRRPTQMVLAHLSQAPVPPFDYVQAPGMLRLSEIVLRMLEKNPANRYDRPEELREDLARAV